MNTQASHTRGVWSIVHADGVSLTGWCTPIVVNGVRYVRISRAHRTVNMARANRCVSVSSFKHPRWYAAALFRDTGNGNASPTRWNEILRPTCKRKGVEEGSLVFPRTLCWIRGNQRSYILSYAWRQSLRNFSDLLITGVHATGDLKKTMTGEEDGVTISEDRFGWACAIQKAIRNVITCEYAYYFQHSLFMASNEW